MPKEDNRPPAFLLYVNDFCSDGIVEAMTTEEVGAYFLLLCKAWMEEPAGTVPDDDRILSRWARLTAAKWAKCKANVMAAFKLKNGRWHQSRMQREYAAWVASKKEKSERGSRAARARWGDADAMHMHCNGTSQAMPKNAISSSLSYSSSSLSLFSERERDFLISIVAEQGVHQAKPAVEAALCRGCLPWQIQRSCAKANGKALLTILDNLKPMQPTPESVKADADIRRTAIVRDMRKRGSSNDEINAVLRADGLDEIASGAENLP